MMTMQAYPAALTNLKVRGTCQARNTGKFFVVSFHFLALQVQPVVLVSVFVWSVQFDQFLVFFLTLGAPVPSHL